MNSNQKFLLIWAIFVVSYILVIAALHWFLDSDVFIIALGLCGMLFISHYYEYVYISPIERSIGRLEGEQKCLVKVRNMLKKKKERS